MRQATRMLEPLISLLDVSKAYRDGNVEALKNVSFDIRAGEFVSIMGPSGCGKSTLLNLIGALDLPTSGEICFAGQPLGQMRDLNRLRAREIGFVFQSFHLLPNLTALENVQIPMFESDLSLRARVERAQDLLAAVGLEERIDHLPKQLSIGQRQRVAIARALANGPRLVLADEPTGSLDSSSGRDVIGILARLNQVQETTIVLVTHDPTIADAAHRLIRMLDGEVLEDAPLRPNSNKMP